MSSSRELSMGRPPRLTRDAPHDVAAPDLVCLSHLRWGFVFQRPQHLMTRFARDRRVFFIEEPVDDSGVPHLVVRRDPSGVLIVRAALTARPVGRRDCRYLARARRPSAARARQS